MSEKIEINLNGFLPILAEIYKTKATCLALQELILPIVAKSENKSLEEIQNTLGALIEKHGQQQAAIFEQSFPEFFDHPE